MTIAMPTTASQNSAGLSQLGRCVLDKATGDWRLPGTGDGRRKKAGHPCLTGRMTTAVIAAARSKRQQRAAVGYQLAAARSEQRPVASSVYMYSSRIREVKSTAWSYQAWHQANHSGAMSLPSKHLGRSSGAVGLGGNLPSCCSPTITR